MPSSHRLAIASISLLTLICVALPASADPGPQAYAEAKAPLPEKEIDRLTRKLESLSAKKNWKKASKLATDKLGGEAWCDRSVALPFRTFAALGVVARRSGQKELALSCTLRSFFLADTQVRIGQVYFELSLLVDAMSVEEFIAFRDKSYGMNVDLCGDQDACCYFIKGYDRVIKSFDPDFYDEPSQDALTDDPAQVKRQKAASSSALLGQAYSYNPSPKLAKRVKKGGRASALESTLAKLPFALLPAHETDSLKEAKTWIRRHTPKKLGEESSRRIELHEYKTLSRGVLHITPVMADLIGEDCSLSEASALYLIARVEGSSTYSIFVDHQNYLSNGCGGYGFSYEIDDPVFQKTTGADAPLFVSSSSEDQYSNGGLCGAEGGGVKQDIYCSVDNGGVPRCLLWSRYTPWDLELDAESQPPTNPSFSFKKGVSDFELSKYSSSVRALIEPLEGVDFMTLYNGLPKVEAQVKAWFDEPEKTEAKPKSKAP